MDDLPPPFGTDTTARRHVCAHCAAAYMAARSDQRFCSDRAIEADDLERLTTLLAEVQRLQRQVTELQSANTGLRDALSRAQMRLLARHAGSRRWNLIDGSRS